MYFLSSGVKGLNVEPCPVQVNQEMLLHMYVS